ncbi:hypothetical protein AVEN_134963-1 [Araneus ventricosus]|uniref:Uncharacterized protein n=1 Tax=Araneus ventricosus TaxID=182803 RepID=A0A4Y2CJ15_ARAVE|nr:hypothetical protein AVEN_134963-1 [Araneus ventricosus]
MDTPGTTVHNTSNESPRTANTWGFQLSMRSKKQTKRPQILMKSSLACLRGMENSVLKNKMNETDFAAFVLLKAMDFSRFDCFLAKTSRALVQLMSGI